MEEALVVEVVIAVGSDSGSDSSSSTNAYVTFNI